ncbi:MAG: hypothetical protein IH899_19695 [Planctomycetes bacterium]|nr:hypothetical protein [Planctomycetota bacterium]
MLAHPVNKRNRWRQFIAFGLVIGLTSDLYSQEEAVETAPAFQAPQLSPSLGDFVTGMPLSKKLKALFTKKLLKEPFAGAAVDGVKGLASKIKAGQVDAKNRVVAIKFLGTVDCAAYPDAQVMLIDSLKNDPSERVRLEAAKAIKEQFGRGKDEGLSAIFTSRREKRRYDHCRGCCGEDALNALSEVAYERDETGCHLEPSERVRKEAREALTVCVSCCSEQSAEMPIEPQEEETPGTPSEEKTTDNTPLLSPVQRDLTQVQKELILLYEQKGLNPPSNPTFPSLDLNPTPPFGESADVVPTGVIPKDVTSSAETGERLHVLSTVVRIGDRKPVVSAKESKQLFRPRLIQVSAESHASTTNEKDAAPLKCVRGFCVVALSQEKLIKGLPEFSSVYDGHTYYFSSAKAKEQFDAEPGRFAPVMAGVDPVLLKQSGKVKQGNYIWRYDNRFYFFVTKQNRSDFLKSPEMYALYSGE